MAHTANTAAIVATELARWSAAADTAASKVARLEAQYSDAFARCETTTMFKISTALHNARREHDAAKRWVRCWESQR